MPSLNNNEDCPRVVIVTALQIECENVVKHLNSTKAEIHPSSQTVYEIGQFLPETGQCWNVLVVQTGPGNSEASSETTSAIDYYNPDVVIVVGIAGGRKDVAIGDVVFATKVYAYEIARDQEDEMLPRGNAYAGGHKLVSRARYEARHKDWLCRLDGYYQNNEPRAYEGAIASGEKLQTSTSSELARFIAKNYSDSLAVEMEGYGCHVAAHRSGIPVLVIRGISDLLEEKAAAEKQGSQRIAADHAAAFAFQILSCIQPSNPAVRPRSKENQPDHTGQRANWVLVLDSDKNAITQDKIMEVEAILRDASNDPSLTIKSYTEGSIVLHVDSDINAYEIIVKQVLNKELQELCGIKIIEIETEKDYVEINEIYRGLRRASEPLLQWPTTLNHGRWIPRRELRQLEDQISQESSRPVILLGGPGTGKSALLARLGHVADEAGYGVLAIRADLLPAYIESQNDLGEWLGIDVDPFGAIRRLSKYKKVILLVDQLDVLGDLVDLHSQRLNVILDLIRKVADLDNVAIILACRKFEYNHDPRLRYIDADSLELEPIPWDEIENILNETGLASNQWDTSWRVLLQQPLYLKLFLEYLPSNRSSDLISTYHGLMEKIWQDRVCSGQCHPECEELLELLASDMGELEELWLPTARYEKYSQTIEHLVSVDFLIKTPDGRKLSFRHQKLFDFARARAFVKQRDSLSDFILKRSNSLFIRPQLWNALIYIRESDISTYKSELNRLWKAKELAFHIKWLLIEYLGSLDNPDEYEQSLMLPLFEDDQYRERVLMAVSGSTGWFDILYKTLLPSLMKEQNNRVWPVVYCLEQAASLRPQKVYRLLNKYWEPGSGYCNSAIRVLRAFAEWDDDINTYTKNLLYYEQVDDHEVSFLVRTISAFSPVYAPSILATHLYRRLKDGIDKANKEQTKALKRIIDHNTAWHDIPAVAEASPKEFVKEIWPWLIDVLNSIPEEYEDDGSCFKKVAQLEIDMESKPYENYLIDSIVIAVTEFASNYEQEFIQFVSKWKSVNLMPIQRILAKGLINICKDHPEEILGFILEDDRRLALGGIHDVHQETKQLIENVVENLSAENRIKLEQYINSYEYNKCAEDEDPERKMLALKYNRRHRLRLLRAFPANALSKTTLKFIQEEERAFPNMPDWDIGPAEGGFIGSPMSANEMEKATNEQIIKILDKLDDSTGWDHPNRWLEGGSIQLSREFESFSKVQPERSIRIINCLKPNKHELAAGSGIKGVAEAGVDSTVVEGLIQDLEKTGFSTEEYRFSVCGALESLLSRQLNISDSTLEIITTWISDENEPIDDIEEDTDEAVNDSILWGLCGGFVLPRGNYPYLAILCRAYLSRKPPEGMRLLDLLETHLQRVESAKIWKALSFVYFKYLSNTPREKAESFLDQLFVSYPSILRTKNGVILLTHLLRWVNTGLAKKWLNIVKHSDWPRANQAYGEMIVLYYAWNQEQEWLKDEVYTIADLPESANDANIQMKAGMAYTVVQLFHIVEYRALAQHLFSKFLKSNNETILGAASNIFRHSNDVLLADDVTRKFLDRLQHKPELFDYGDASLFLESLADLITWEPELISKVCLTFLDRIGERITDYRTTLPMAGDALVNIALTLHRLEDPYRQRGIDIFEKLLWLKVSDAQQTLEELDRRSPVAQKRQSRRRRRRK